MRHGAASSPRTSPRRVIRRRRRPWSAWRPTDPGRGRRRPLGCGPMSDSRQHLDDVDPVVAALAALEAERRAATIDLIASESEMPPAIREALGSAFAGKTAEGYPGHRYHRGTVQADALETLACDRATNLFAADHANVQP